MSSKHRYNQGDCKGSRFECATRRNEYLLGCTLAKAKQKNVVRFSQHERSKVPGEIIFIDLSSVKPPELVISMPNCHWHIIVDECTNFKVSHFYKKKNQQAESTCELLDVWGSNDIVTKYI